MIIPDPLKFLNVFLVYYCPNGDVLFTAIFTVKNFHFNHSICIVVTPEVMHHISFNCLLILYLQHIIFRELPNFVLQDSIVMAYYNVY